MQWHWHCCLSMLVLVLCFAPAGSGSTVLFLLALLQHEAFRRNTSSRWQDRSLENLAQMTHAVANSDLLRSTAVESGLVYLRKWAVVFYPRRE